MDINVLIEKLELSYRQLKCHAYFDKSEAILRTEIAKFETEDFEKEIKILASKLNDLSDGEWEEYIEQEIEKNGSL